MVGKKQFKGGVKPRTHFDKKLISSGNTKYLAMGKLLPKDWQYVRCEVKRRDKNAVSLRITKLYGENNDTRTKRANQKGKQNT